MENCLMKTSDVSLALASLLPTRRPLYLWGPPGVGKSSLVRQAAGKAGLPVVDVRAVLLDPVDLRGLPRIQGDSALWCPPAFLPRDGEGVLFLDELAQAPPLVQAACLQLTLDRRVGEYVLPQGWSVVAAGNRQEDRAGAHRLISPLLNRFVHLDLEVSADDWHDWAVGAGVAPEVRSFLRYRPALLFAFDPSTNARSFPTPRSWEFVSQVLPHTPQELLHPVVSGCVGEGPAAEFVGFATIYKELPDPDQVLASPATTSVPREPAVLYALCGALVERCRKASPKVLAAFVQYVGRMPDEFGVLAMRDALAVAPKLLTLADAQAWLARARQRGLFASAQ
jgi:hypothetical protein